MGDAFQRVRHHHRAYDVAGNEKLKTKDDRAPQLLPEGFIGLAG